MEKVGSASLGTLRSARWIRRGLCPGPQRAPAFSPDQSRILVYFEYQYQGSDCPWASGSRRRDLGSRFANQVGVADPSSSQPLTKHGVAWSGWFYRESHTER